MVGIVGYKHLAKRNEIILEFVQIFKNPFVAKTRKFRNIYRLTISVFYFFRYEDTYLKFANFTGLNVTRVEKIVINLDQFEIPSGLQIYLRISVHDTFFLMLNVNLRS